MTGNITVKHQWSKALVLFLFGAVLYAMIEILWRGYTHWTMAVLGGVLFLILGGLNNWIPWEMPLALQIFIGTVVVTLAEFLSGLVLNVWLGLGIWDYSGIPGNIMGQICPQFSAAWAALSLVGIILDDYLRYWLFSEQRPHYYLFWRKSWELH